MAMRIGIFARTFQRPTFEGVLDAVAAVGIRDVHLDVEPDADAAALRAALDARGLRAAGLSGTFNMAHPDPAEREAGLRWLDGVASLARPLGASILSLCTGTRNTTSMWRPHADNGTPAAWRDMLEAVTKAAAIAERHGVTFAFEPEVSNVVDSARKARRLLDEVGSPRVKVLLDPANIFHAGELPRMAELIDEAFELLGPAVVMAHAKDLDRDGEAGHLAAGTGRLDYDRYVGHLKRIGFDGSIILHGLTEAQAPGCVAFLRSKIAGRS
jgi:sugar phosphate isomerase/epimerase